jgi:PAS domain S-box-containing protein
VSVRPAGRAALPTALVALVIAPVAWVLASLVLSPHQASELVVGSLAIGLVLAAARAAWRASRLPSADATAWMLIAASLLVFSLYIVTSLIVEVAGLADGWQTVAGVFGLLFRLLIALAIVSFPLLASTTRSRWRARLDVLVVGSMVAFLAWAWVLGQLFHHAIPGTPAARAALFSLVDVVLVIIVLMASLRRPAGVRDATRLLGIGLVFLAITDWHLATSETTGTTDMTPFAAVTAIIAVAFVAGGAWLANRPVTGPPVPSTHRHARGLFPIGLAAVAFATGITTPHPWDPALIGLGLAAGVMLLAWQVAMVLEGEEMVATLSEQGQRFSTLVATAPIAIIETDREGVVTVANAEAGRILDREPAALVGRHLDLETEDEEDRGLRDRVIDGEVLRDVRLPLRRPDGEVLDLLVSSAPIADRSGAVSGVVWTGSDDGPRLRGFAAMIAVQRMQAYEQLTSGIAHDFNNRLAVILGTTEILLDGAADDDQREMLQAVLSSGRRAAALVERLVGTTGRKCDDREHLDLADLVAELEPDLVRLSPPDTTITIDIGDQPLPVEADGSDLRQAITNLVVNATEATGGGGTVAISARLARPAEGDGPTMVELVVADDGAGMDAATEARIFEPFFTTRVGGGHSRGLGLPAVQGVVLRSRGEIEVDTRPGAGTSVTVRLPRHEPIVEPEPIEAPPALAPVADARATVLLVDDEAQVRQITGRVLTSAGYEVVSACDAAEAMSILVSGDAPIDIVVTDVVMPGRSGVELAHDVTTRHPGLPVLLMSGFVGESAHAGITADLPFPLLSKPTPRATLLEAVADLLPVPA